MYPPRRKLDLHLKDLAAFCFPAGIQVCGFSSSSNHEIRFLLQFILKKLKCRYHLRYKIITDNVYFQLNIDYISANFFRSCQNSEEYSGNSVSLIPVTRPCSVTLTAFLFDNYYVGEHIGVFRLIYIQY